MGPLTRARRLAQLRLDVADQRPLTIGERHKRADAYVAAMSGEPLWIRAWSGLMTWHMDKVERWDVDALVTERIAARNRAAIEQAQARHPVNRPSPHPRGEIET